MNAGSILINEPANILNTNEFAKRLKALECYGLKVEVLDERYIEKQGMNALLGVGQGSKSPSKVVIIRWEGLKADEKPLLFVGKGVVFDRSGYSFEIMDVSNNFVNNVKVIKR